MPTNCIKIFNAFYDVDVNANPFHGNNTFTILYNQSEISGEGKSDEMKRAIHCDVA